MSAIAALVYRDERHDAREVVARMNAVQAHRGGDGVGTLALEGAALGRQLQLYDSSPLGETERSIIPNNARAAIVFDGRIFNGAELARELGIMHDSPSTEAEDLIVLESYERWGKGCASHLHGDFAFAIWNLQERLLFAARDIVGARPLFYHLASNGELTLASEIKAILRNDRVPRRIDLEAIAQYLFEKSFIQPRTPLVDIAALMPGQCLIWKDGSIALEDFWNVPFYDKKIADEEYAVRQYRETLLGAISERLPRDGSSPGLLYSGGTDSNLLLGMLHHVTDKQIRTFTIIEGMSERDLNYSRKLTRQFNTDHTEVRLSPRKIAENLVDQVWFYNTPGVGAFQAYFGTLAAREKGTKVAFGGFAVEATLDPPWFISYMTPFERICSPLRLIPDATRTGIYDIAERILRKPARSSSTSKMHRILQTLYSYVLFKRGIFPWYDTGYTQKVIESLFLRGIDQTGWVPTKDTYRALYRTCESADLHDRCNCVMLRTGFHINNVPKFEGGAATNKVLLQFPFLDQKVVELSLRIPLGLKQRRGRNKYILRENCREFVSDECAELSKQRFAPPFRRWMIESLWPIVQTLLSRESIDRRAIFDYGRITAVCEEFRGAETALKWVDIWAIVTLELWLRLHVDPAPEDVSKHPTEWLRELVLEQ